MESMVSCTSSRRSVVVIFSSVSEEAASEVYMEAAKNVSPIRRGRKMEKMALRVMVNR